jgi:hypothetical protein
MITNKILKKLWKTSALKLSAIQKMSSLYQSFPGEKNFNLDNSHNF